MGKRLLTGRMNSMGHYFSNFTVLGHLSKPTKYSSCPRDSGVLTWTEVDQGSKKQTRKKKVKYCLLALPMPSIMSNDI